MDYTDYEELYKEQLEKAKYWEDRYNAMDKALTASRKENLEVCRARAGQRYDYASLHQRAEAFLDHLKRDIVTPAIWKNGWMYPTALDPETALAFTSKFGKFSTYVDEKKPPIL